MACKPCRNAEDMRAPHAQDTLTCINVHPLYLRHSGHHRAEAIRWRSCRTNVQMREGETVSMSMSVRIAAISIAIVLFAGGFFAVAGRTRLSWGWMYLLLLDRGQRESAPGYCGSGTPAFWNVAAAWAREPGPGTRCASVCLR